MGVGKCVTKGNPKSDLDLDSGFVKMSTKKEFLAKTKQPLTQHSLFLALYADKFVSLIVHCNVQNIF